MMKYSTKCCSGLEGKVVERVAPGAKPVLISELVVKLICGSVSISIVVGVGGGGFGVGNKSSALPTMSSISLDVRGLSRKLVLVGWAVAMFEGDPFTGMVQVDSWDRKCLIQFSDCFFVMEV